ncbi:TetR family transcriptional regulator [Amycolatopsis antarctica]|uniref:TetR family transcriptional regulator n=2 Tax=Amycolatopsis antarctica TaxID=1854586 RepID=A0A263D927_9PSEU|nr:TetR family transcriptional regulator [Amycolatopsis antarctica]
MFAERGPDAPMEEIARRAGVGVGTLYRRFPDREALLRAVTVDNFNGVVSDGRTAAAEEPNAWLALCRFVRECVESRMGVALLPQSGRSSAIIRDDPHARDAHLAMVKMVQGLVNAAKDEGALRDDVEAGDVVVLLSLLLRPVYHPTPEVGMVAAARSVTVVLDGLRARSAVSPLPGRSLTGDDLTPREPRAMADEHPEYR